MTIKPLLLGIFILINVLVATLAGSIFQLDQSFYVNAIIVGALVSLTNLGLIFQRIIKPQQSELTKLQEKLQISDASSMTELFDVNEHKMTGVGQEIGERASELAINSAQVAFFVQQLASDIDLSGDDASRVAAATEELAANTKEINHNALMTAQSAQDVQSASEHNKLQLQNNIERINSLHRGVNEVIPS
ncbi:hypothetical protein ACMAZF_08805 [Psychrobium sp. nBUS_13]|uniref:hypothetical protein n=1 Tax=Psychrobium sp. nBUS_13 TaxID=3395319 RepID=UPI003EB7FD53